MIELVEVSPRDGLQNEGAVLSTADKVELISRAEKAGLKRIEVASFVDPRRVPQMADAEAVVEALPPSLARRIGLVLNVRGAERALATSIDELGVVCAATDAFGVRNQGHDRKAGLAMAEAVLARAAAAGRTAHVTLAVAFGCPFEGAVDPAGIVEAARRLVAAGSSEIALADTIGIARPGEVAHLVSLVADALRPLPVRAHFHDTRGMGVANALAAIQAGAKTVDASIGGTGGCPFSPGASGNVATEDVAYGMGGQTLVDVEQLVQTAFWLNHQLGRTDLTAQMRKLLADGTFGPAASRRSFADSLGSGAAP